MATFGAGAQLGQHPVIDAVLGIDETLEIERAVHGSTVPHPYRCCGVIDSLPTAWRQSRSR